MMTNQEYREYKRECQKQNKLRIAKQTEIIKLAKKSSVVTNIYKNHHHIQIDCKKQTKAITNLLEKLKELCPYYHTNAGYNDETTDYWFYTYDDSNEEIEINTGDFEVVVVIKN